MTSDAALVGLGLHLAGELGVPVRIGGELVRVPPGAVPAPEPLTEEQCAAAQELLAQSSKPEIEAVRRLCYILNVTGVLMSPLVDALTRDAAANSNAPASATTIPADDPPPIKEPAASVAWATSGDRLAHASDAVPLGSNAFLVGGEIVVERDGDLFTIRRRYADVAEAATAASEQGALTIARRMANDTTDKDTPT